MITKLLLALFTLPLFGAALLLPTATKADTVYDVPTLTNLLISADDFTTLGASAGNVTEGKPSSDDMGTIVSRKFSDPSDGDEVVVNLFSLKSGQPLSGSDADDVTNGNLLQQYAKANWDSVDLFRLGDPLQGNDVLGVFAATKNGTSNVVTAVSFTKGNIGGIITYSTLGDPKPENLGVIYGLQLNKLP